LYPDCLLRWGLTFSLGWLWTVILPIYTFQAGGITDTYHHAQPSIFNYLRNCYIFALIFISFLIPVLVLFFLVSYLLILGYWFESFLLFNISLYIYKFPPEHCFCCVL
jgi:hypothetical protein